MSCPSWQSQSLKSEMAKIDQMPSQVIIDSFFGVVDFYLYKGQACARMWPNWRRRTAWPAESLNQEIFGYASKMWRFLPEYVKQAYNQMAVSLPVTGRDIFIRGYIVGAKNR